MPGSLLGILLQNNSVWYLSWAFCKYTDSMYGRSMLPHPLENKHGYGFVLMNKVLEEVAHVSLTQT